jgi:Uma2 family endonuclease
MGDPATTQLMTASEFLAWERAEASKHEYNRGEVFAMAGGSPRHNYLSSRAIAELHRVVRPRGCHTLSSDQRISADGGERFVYADAVVVCGGFRPEVGTTDVLANPEVIVEVLSRSTESYDRGEKWAAYQRLTTLRDYLLVSQGSVRVEHYQRGRSGDEGAWGYRTLSAGETLTLSHGGQVSIDALYEGAFELETD